MAGWDTKGPGGTTIDATDRLRAALRRLGRALRRRKKSPERAD